MPKKRLIFTLLWENGSFMLSRNFRLQKVGDLDWILKHYNFRNIAFSIDELIILNVSRDDKEWGEFSFSIKQIVDTCFIPIAAGGGIKSEEDAELLIKSGADKLVLNSSLYENPDLVKNLIKIYGSQCIIASIDFRSKDNIEIAYNSNGQNKIEMDFELYIDYIDKLKVGEIYFNSMDQDGTGQGYCLNVVEKYSSKINIPLIMAGGAGNADHFIAGVNLPGVDAVATANLFNFIGDGFPDARDQMIKNKIDLAIWDRDAEKKMYKYFHQEV